MSRTSAYDEMIRRHRREKSELLELTQKMKDSVPNDDNDKINEVMAEIAGMIADMDLKHEAEAQQLASTSKGQLKRTEGSEENIIVDGKQAENFEIAPDSQNSAIPKKLSKAQKRRASTSKGQLKRTEGSEENIIVDGEQAENFEIAPDSQNSAIPKKLSKAQKRRNKKAQLARDREAAIAEQEIANLSGARFLEGLDISSKLAQRNLLLHEIPSDGNCLFKAIEHQLSVHNVKELTAEDLRELTSDYLYSHKDEFQPFLINPQTNDMFTDEEYLNYCINMKQPSVWGGQIEIQALTQICGMPIEVIQANGANVISGENIDGPKLQICFHKFQFGLGAHYNSCKPK